MLLRKSLWRQRVWFRLHFRETLSPVGRGMAPADATCGSAGNRPIVILLVTIDDQLKINTISSVYSKIVFRDILYRIKVITGFEYIFFL